MQLSQGSDKINDFIKQAASLYVVNTVYFVSLMVLCLFVFHVSDLQAGWLENVPVLMAGSFLAVVFLFKLAMHYYTGMQSILSEEQFELIVAVLNVFVTFSLVEALAILPANESTLLLLYSFLPTMLWVLISPLTWNKTHASFAGFYGFLEWTLLLSVLAWSLQTIFVLYQMGSHLALGSNLIVLASPFFLRFIRQRHMAKLSQKMHVEIYTDPLTGISNRKCFYDYYDGLRQQNRDRQFKKDGMMVLFIDIDHFKQYNDYYGHDAGDDCLAYVAQYLAELAEERPGWQVFRYGGEEFLMCAPISESEWLSLPEEPLFSTWVAGEMPLDRLHEPTERGVLTISGGGCFISAENMYKSNAGSVTKLADKRLYQAKETRGLLVLS
jgi:diguanylate cyclase (GGDEF)-like protein